ncbi:DNA/RNA nuclease SfsA [Thiospirochaeta perfilievii]|uniref:DNA/RNA nuclease SfsA n=1 Tax=Thiospirochaeta perfilievii TaxID=252967 RepID=UPI0016595BCF|nr:DNA/RNA nuclease SfsA [Thiospirochaeta perfilievii]
MKIFNNDFYGIFIKRPNRFIIYALLNGKEVVCHCPNTGRMGELLIPGVKLILEKSQNPKRKTEFTVVAIYKGELIVPITSARANDVAQELIIPKLFPELDIRREVTYKKSRFDFFIGGTTYIEVKSCTLFNGELAVFPDAPTIRGVKHLKELLDSSNNGYSAAVILVVFNPEAKLFTPNYITDPLFAQTLFDVSSNIKVFPYKVGVDPMGNIMEVENPILPISYKGDLLG